MPRPSLVRTLVTALASLAAAGQLAYLGALVGNAGGAAPPSWAGVSATVATTVVAHAILALGSAAWALRVVFAPAEREPAASRLALAIGAWSYLLSYPGIVLLLRPEPGLARSVFEGHFLLVETIGLAGLIRFTAIFSGPDGPAGHGGAAAGSPFARIPRALRRFAERPVAVWVAALAIPGLLLTTEGVRGRPLADAGLHPAMDVVRVTAATAVVLGLHHAWAHRASSARRPLAWLLTALAVLVTSVLLVIGGNILLSATSWRDPAVAWRPVVLDLGVLGFVSCLAASALAGGRVDPAAVARRVATGATLGLAALFTATVLEVLLASGIFGPVAFPPGAGALLGVLAIAASAAPMGRWARRVLDRLPGFDAPDPTGA